MNWHEWSTIADNEIYWQSHEEKGLLKAEYVTDYILRLWFEDNLDVSIYELDFYPLIIDENPGDALLPLREKSRFQQVIGDYALIWPDPENGEYTQNTIDLAPECIRFYCDKYGTILKHSQKAVA